MSGVKVLTCHSDAFHLNTREKRKEKKTNSVETRANLTTVQWWPAVKFAQLFNVRNTVQASQLGHCFFFASPHTSSCGIQTRQAGLTVYSKQNNRKKTWTWRMFLLLHLSFVKASMDYGFFRCFSSTGGGGGEREGG